MWKGDAIPEFCVVFTKMRHKVGLLVGDKSVGALAALMQQDVIVFVKHWIEERAHVLEMMHGKGDNGQACAQNAHNRWNVKPLPAFGL